MHWKTKTEPLLVILSVLATGCASNSPNPPEVRVVQTCPAQIPRPAKLSTPIDPVFLMRLESLLTAFSKSVQTPMKRPEHSTP